MATQQDDFTSQNNEISLAETQDFNDTTVDVVEPTLVEITQQKSSSESLSQSMSRKSSHRNASGNSVHSRDSEQIVSFPLKQDSSGGSLQSQASEAIHSSPLKQNPSGNSITSSPSLQKSKSDQLVAPQESNQSVVSRTISSYLASQKISRDSNSSDSDQIAFSPFKQDYSESSLQSRGLGQIASSLKQNSSGINLQSGISQDLQTPTSTYSHDYIKQQSLPSVHSEQKVSQSQLQSQSSQQSTQHRSNLNIKKIVSNQAQVEKEVLPEYKQLLQNGKEALLEMVRSKKSIIIQENQSDHKQASIEALSDSKPSNTTMQSDPLEIHSVKTLSLLSISKAQSAPLGRISSDVPILKPSISEMAAKKHGSDCSVVPHNSEISMDAGSGFMVPSSQEIIEAEVLPVPKYYYLKLHQPKGRHYKMSKRIRSNSSPVSHSRHTSTTHARSKSMAMGIVPSQERIEAEDLPKHHKLQQPKSKSSKDISSTSIHSNVPVPDDNRSKDLVPSQERIEAEVIPNFHNLPQSSRIDLSEQESTNRDGSYIVDNQEIIESEILPKYYNLPKSSEQQSLHNNYYPPPPEFNDSNDINIVSSQERIEREYLPKYYDLPSADETDYYLDLDTTQDSQSHFYYDEEQTNLNSTYDSHPNYSTPRSGQIPNLSVWLSERKGRIENIRQRVDKLETSCYQRHCQIVGYCEDNFGALNEFIVDQNALSRYIEKKMILQTTKVSRLEKHVTKCSKNCDNLTGYIGEVFNKCQRLENKLPTPEKFMNELKSIDQKVSVVKGQMDAIQFATSYLHVHN